MSATLRSILMKRRKPEMISFLLENPEYFEEAMELALQNEVDHSWRAAWMIVGTVKKNDPRIKPYILKILDIIPDRRDGHQRELLKILLTMKLEEDFESLLFDLSVQLWEQIRKKPSVRYYAFKGMINVAEKYPELKNEVLSLTQPHFVNPLSAGIRKGILKEIEELRKG